MQLKFVHVLILVFCVLQCFGADKYYPILLWHSAGETCCDREGNLYSNYIENELENQVTIKSVKIGETKEDDFTLSLTVHPFEQINIVCNKLKNNEKFQNGYNAIGLSQGALFLRGLAQICPYPPMKNLISLGGPQQGVNQYPRCEEMWGKTRCNLLKFKLNFKAYRHLFQKFLTPASYWHDDMNEERYRRGSSFLAVINNENHYNADYVKNLKSLKRIILVKFMKDTSLIPNESSWLGFASRNGTTFAMEETHTYRNNRLGLREMNNEGKIIRLESPLEHLQLDKVWFRDKIIPVLKEQ